MDLLLRGWCFGLISACCGLDFPAFGVLFFVSCLLILVALICALVCGLGFGDACFRCFSSGLLWVSHFGFECSGLICLFGLVFGCLFVLSLVLGVLGSA